MNNLQNKIVKDNFVRVAIYIIYTYMGNFAV